SPNTGNTAVNRTPLPELKYKPRPGPCSFNRLASRDRRSIWACATSLLWTESGDSVRVRYLGCRRACNPLAPGTAICTAAVSGITRARAPSAAITSTATRPTNSTAILVSTAWYPTVSAKLAIDLIAYLKPSKESRAPKPLLRMNSKAKPWISMLLLLLTSTLTGRRLLREGGIIGCTSAIHSPETSTRSAGNGTRLTDQSQYIANMNFRSGALCALCLSCTPSLPPVVARSEERTGQNQLPQAMVRSTVLAAPTPRLGW